MTLIGALAATLESHHRPLIKTSRLKLLKYHYHHSYHRDRLPHLSFMYSYLSLFFFYPWHLPVFI